MIQQKHIHTWLHDKSQLTFCLWCLTWSAHESGLFRQPMKRSRNKIECDRPSQTGSRWWEAGTQSLHCPTPAGRLVPSYPAASTADGRTSWRSKHTRTHISVNAMLKDITRVVPIPTPPSQIPQIPQKRCDNVSLDWVESISIIVSITVDGNIEEMISGSFILPQCLCFLHTLSDEWNSSNYSLYCHIQGQFEIAILLRGWTVSPICNNKVTSSLYTLV